MKVGIIGLGDIATKAYLPVITGMQVELVLCSRTSATVHELASKYRIKEYCYDYRDLPDFMVDAVFIHTATSSHYTIAKYFLSKGIHVYVDKPISDRLEETLELYELALEREVVLMVGFNRRYVPDVTQLKAMTPPDTLIIQKNRHNLPGDVRTFIYDDFIHVVDTLLHLFGAKTFEIDHNAQFQKDQITALILMLKENGRTAIGSMNRMSGAKEERIEYMANNVKHIIEDLDRLTVLESGKSSSYKSDDWTPVLMRRGFYDIITTFLNWTQNPSDAMDALEASILSHEVCEYLVMAYASEG